MMMRMVLILLAVYTLMLACIPCQDEAAADPLHVVISVSADLHQPHPSDLDLCSPFCVCACCASVTLQQVVASVPSVPAFISFEEITFAYLSGTNSGDLTSIWQPPRI